jgi:hypothetical protein
MVEATTRTQQDMEVVEVSLVVTAGEMAAAAVGEADVEEEMEEVVAAGVARR